MQFKSLLVLASLAVSSFAQTSVAQVENDINNIIAPDLSTLLTDIDAFPTSGGNLIQALTIHTDATSLISALATTTNDVNGATCPVSDSDANTILADLQALLPNIQQAATDIVARKAAFTALPLGGVPALVQQDLASLKSNTDTLAAAFIACAPAGVVVAAQELQSEIDAAFAPAIAAFN
ncbi:hypothetical protein E4T56_gene18051 [Termitomyces sp. T112]|nr:hypothetical protein C0989_007327 [Termitomyces sp. Mn162]KAG5717658.1 hypothetical protein E4T56_gene18051 [Termitomyces sp. T112]KAH0580933.1 hypothetical protein H2248_012085 [Termitomyces sp. 'cryptogamus']